MKSALLISLLLLIGLNTAFAQGQNLSAYFERPLNCPLRYSNLTGLRDQMQLLISALGTSCSQANQQALAQLNSGVANLEGVASTWKTYNETDEKAGQAQFAKNLNQILGNLNVITSNQSCFYDIRSRGALPVIADVVMSLSQFGLLIPSSTGMFVAAGGYVVGSGLKIINELVKKKFNFNKPEERRAFLQLNCSFFDYRKQIDEAGIFSPETEAYKNNLVSSLKKERALLIKNKKTAEIQVLKAEKDLDAALMSIPEVQSRNLDPALIRNLDLLADSMSKRPGEISEKLRQVHLLSTYAEETILGLEKLIVDRKNASQVRLLIAVFKRVLPELGSEGKAWTNNIDEFEAQMRGPLMAYIPTISSIMKQDLKQIESELALEDEKLVKKIASLRMTLKDDNDTSWAKSLRLSSLDSKIASLETVKRSELFSDQDESSANAVEILEYYRKLQDSILGKEGKGYLKSAIDSSYALDSALEHQLSLYSPTLPTRERCSVAEKVRFAWAQYRYKVQEAHDFVSTNFDLARSKFKVGNEWMKRSNEYVLSQIDSVEVYLRQEKTQDDSIGDLMNRVIAKQNKVESLLENSKCF